MEEKDLPLLLLEKIAEKAKPAQRKKVKIEGPYRVGFDTFSEEFPTENWAREIEGRELLLNKLRAAVREVEMD